jgi:hypothetical protein
MATASSADVEPVNHETLHRAITGLITALPAGQEGA